MLWGCDCERFAASQLLESKGDWNTKHAQEGVYFHGLKTSQRAQNYTVFEIVFFGGALICVTTLQFVFDFVRARLCWCMKSARA